MKHLERENEPSSSIEGAVLLDQISDCQLFSKAT